MGTPGSQRLVTYRTEKSGTADVIWDAIYFDGLGRVTATLAEGPDNKMIARIFSFNNRGLKAGESLPYFVAQETPRYISYEYDPVGRVVLVINPDGTSAATIYDKGRTSIIDANGHKRVEEKDLYGRLVSVEEYSGENGNYSPYATTTYQYDTLGNLTRTTDALGNQINITYDTLGRKVSTNDPDMGVWTYLYDANNNLATQTDAKGKTITFTYDALNRVTKKRLSYRY